MMPSGQLRDSVLEIDIHCDKRSAGSFFEFQSDHWMPERQLFYDWSHLMEAREFLKSLSRCIKGGSSPFPYVS